LSLSNHVDKTPYLPNLNWHYVVTFQSPVAVWGQKFWGAAWFCAKKYVHAPKEHFSKHFCIYSVKKTHL